MKPTLSRLALGLSLLSVLLAAEPPAPPKLDPDLPSQAAKSDAVTYEVDFAVVVTPPAHTKLLRVWLPLPPSDGGQEVREKEITTSPMKVKPRLGRENTYGNQFAYFEFKEPQGARSSAIVSKSRFGSCTGTSIRRRWRRWSAGPRPSLPTCAATEALSWTTASARSARSCRARRGEMLDLADVMAWVNGHMRYNHVGASLEASSEHALVNRVGDCSDYHGLMARPSAVPWAIRRGWSTASTPSPRTRRRIASWRRICRPTVG